jgi:hypothetical protein
MVPYYECRGKLELSKHMWGEEQHNIYYHIQAFRQTVFEYYAYMYVLNII